MRNVRPALAMAAGVLLPQWSAHGGRYRQDMAYPLTAAQAQLGELVADPAKPPPRHYQRARPAVAALISIDDLADLEDRAALAAHLADKAACRGGISLMDLDAALDQMDAEPVMSLTVVFRRRRFVTSPASAARTRTCSAGHVAQLRPR